MGDKIAVNQENNRVTLYTCQRDVVVNIIQTQGVYFAKQRFIKEKYGEVAHLFLAAYQWYAKAASRQVPKPAEAESAIWAFCSRQDVDASDESKVLTLSVPLEEAVLFDMLEWTDILNFRYLGEGREAFADKLREQGVADPTAVVTTPFHPMLKRELEMSWNALFRHNGPLKSGEAVPVDHIQAGLWQIKREWVVAAE